MFYVTLNPSIPSGDGDTRYTHIWCKAIEDGTDTVRMLGFNGGAMVVPRYINTNVPTILAVNEDPALAAFKPSHTGAVVGHIVL